jgi:hypothetical protein
MPCAKALVAKAVSSKARVFFIRFSAVDDSKGLAWLVAESNCEVYRP